MADRRGSAMQSVLDRLPFRWNLWFSARLLPLVAKRGSLGKLLELATPENGSADYFGLSHQEILSAVKTVTRRPWRMRGRRCLREGLLGYRFLAMAGYRPVLHFGVIPSTMSTDRPRAHCWISLDGEVVLNPASEPMLELFSYAGSVPGKLPVMPDFG
jgi:hypothetical protein